MPTYERVFRDVPIAPYRGRKRHTDSSFAQKRRQQEKEQLEKFAEHAVEKRNLLEYCLRCPCRAKFGRLYLPYPKDWSSLPKRKRDNSTVLQLEKYEPTLSLTSGPTVDIERDGGIERQYTQRCTACLLELGYTDKPFGAERKVIYFHPNVATCTLRSPKHKDDKRSKAGPSRLESEPAEQKNAQDRISSEETSCTFEKQKTGEK